jgi:hypothetical protein
MKYDRPWNMVKKLLELFNAQSKLKKTDVMQNMLESDRKWRFFSNNTADLPYI